MGHNVPFLMYPPIAGSDKPSLTRFQLRLCALVFTNNKVNSAMIKINKKKCQKLLKFFAIRFKCLFLKILHQGYFSH